MSKNLVNRSTNWYQKRMLEMFCLELFNLQNANILLYDWSLVFHELQTASLCRKFNLDSIDEFTKTLLTLIFDIEDKHIFSIIYFFKHVICFFFHHAYTSKLWFIWNDISSQILKRLSNFLLNEKTTLFDFRIKSDLLKQNF